ncbi:type VII secretion target [Mycobacterium sp. SMC-18]|uniref:type VII secretion target n=1 Tax=Mycobacterium sp. SMC-18 TaxID=3381629 RepID=UPI0038767893
MALSNLKVDPARLRSLAGEFSEIAVGLKAAPSPAGSGPSWQPSAAAVSAVSAGIDHLDGECATALTEFGANLTKAATAYEAADAAGGAGISRAMPGR